MCHSEHLHVYLSVWCTFQMLENAALAFMWQRGYANARCFQKWGSFTTRSRLRWLTDTMAGVLLSPRKPLVARQLTYQGKTVSVSTNDGIPAAQSVKIHLRDVGVCVCVWDRKNGRKVGGWQAVGRVKYCFENVKRSEIGGIETGNMQKCSFTHWGEWICGKWLTLPLASVFWLNVHSHQSLYEVYLALELFQPGMNPTRPSLFQDKLQRVAAISRQRNNHRTNTKRQTWLKHRDANWSIQSLYWVL